MNKFAVITAGRERGGGGESIAENPAERRAVADDLRRAMVAAAEFGISRIGTCPLNDGADTLFELDYARAYDSAAETFGAACAHNPAITDRIDSARVEVFLAERNSAKALPYLYSLLCMFISSPRQ